MGHFRTWSNYAIILQNFNKIAFPLAFRVLIGNFLKILGMCGGVKGKKLDLRTMKQFFVQRNNHYFKEAHSAIFIDLLLMLLIVPSET